MPKDVAFYRRLGHLIVERHEPDMRMSRAIQICKTWRTHFAWHLTNALGWRSGVATAVRAR